MINGVRIGVLGLCLLLAPIMSIAWVRLAKSRLDGSQQTDRATPAAAAAVAAAADEHYCTPELKKILRRVLQSCGLLGKGSGRGCQPLQAKNVAMLSGRDFNALFKPMKDRGGIIQFELGKADLDRDGTELIDKVFAQQRGASYFFIVSRASPEGSVRYNRKLSQRRAEAVMRHLRETFKDPDLEREVGLLWLGEEFAQLDRAFCSWRRSGAESECRARDINRSAFIAWIDCQL